MDGFHEKKWFVYVGDHHEGPFSLAEVQDKMANGQVSSTSYVWAEGMADWKAMTEVAEFEAVLGGAADDGMEMGVASAATGSGHPSPVRGTERSLTDIRMSESEAPIASSVSMDNVQNQDGPPSGRLKEMVSNAGRMMKRMLPIVIVGALVIAYLQGALDPLMRNPAVQSALNSASNAAQPLLLKLVEKVPQLGEFISPLPALEDARPADYEDLKHAAGTKLEDGPRVALALSQSDLFSPVFYVASNLPDGASFDLYIDGVPDSLLNQLSFSTKLTAIITKKLGKTPPAQFPDGKRMPRGEYTVTAVESEIQPPEAKAVIDKVTNLPKRIPPVLNGRVPKVLKSEVYFLGGPKDTIYTQRLKEFHDKIREKATGELNETKQFAGTLESQLTATIDKFTALKKPKITPAMKKDWAAFDATWAKMNEELQKSFVKWTPEALANEYFYGMIYSLVQAAGTAVAQAHATQGAYFAGQANPSSFDIQLGQEISAAQAAVTALKAKIEQAEKIPPSPNGMPKKEGL